MNILDKIVASKKTEVAQAKEVMPVAVWRQMKHYDRTPLSLTNKLSSTTKPGIIAEHKRRSPSKGVINDTSALEDVVRGYDRAGAAAISVLTDKPYFGGTVEHILAARDVCELPLLRKDFVVDAYQIVQAKAIGADLILLIAEVLSSNEVRDLAHCAHDLGLEVLLEMHDEKGIEKITDQVNLVGINNRNLKTFEVDLEKSISLLAELPQDRPCIAESGIEDAATVSYLWEAGFRGFLIGERFMRTMDPAKACQQFIEAID